MSKIKSRATYEVVKFDENDGSVVWRSAHPMDQRIAENWAERQNQRLETENETRYVFLAREIE